MGNCEDHLLFPHHASYTHSQDSHTINLVDYLLRYLYGINLKGMMGVNYRKLRDP